MLLYITVQWIHLRQTTIHTRFEKAGLRTHDLHNVAACGQSQFCLHQCTGQCICSQYVLMAIR